MYWARKSSSHPITLRTPVASMDAFLPTRSEEMAPNTEPSIAPTASRACIVRVREGVGGFFFSVFNYYILTSGLSTYE